MTFLKVAQTFCCTSVSFQILQTLFYWVLSSRNPQNKVMKQKNNLKCEKNFDLFYNVPNRTLQSNIKYICRSWWSLKVSNNAHQTKFSLNLSKLSVKTQNVECIVESSLWYHSVSSSTAASQRHRILWEEFKKSISCSASPWKQHLGVTQKPSCYWTPPWLVLHRDDCQEWIDRVGGPRMRSARYPPLSAAGKAQRRRGGVGDTEGEWKTVRKEKKEQHGHDQRLQLMCETVLRCRTSASLLCRTAAPLCRRTSWG